MPSLCAVSVSPTRFGEKARLLNHLTSPHCVIWSAVAASAAFPGLYEAQSLLARDRRGQFCHFHSLEAQRIADDLQTPRAVTSPRRWRDGSVEAGERIVGQVISRALLTRCSQTSRLRR